MKSILVLRKMKVTNANTIAGLTYGFPPISNFLGFTHALSRFLNSKLGLSLGGCAVVCHRHHVNTHQSGGRGDHVFSLTRNPLTQEAKTSGFVEEGRMQLEISLIIECNFDSYDFDFESDDDGTGKFEALIHDKVQTMRIAGGTIESVERVSFAEVPDEFEKSVKFARQQMRSLLPGFFLVSRSDLLASHHKKLLAANPEAEIMDSWLDFVAYKQQAQPTESAPIESEIDLDANWERITKPAAGWLVPIAVGFKGISPLFDVGEVARSRDPKFPFRFVESVYSIGQWLSPHRVRRLENLFWHYHMTGDWYLCQNNFQPEAEAEGQSTF